MISVRLFRFGIFFYVCVNIGWLEYVPFKIFSSGIDHVGPLSMPSMTYDLGYSGYCFLITHPQMSELWDHGLKWFSMGSRYLPVCKYKRKIHLDGMEGSQHEPPGSPSSHPPCCPWTQGKPAVIHPSCHSSHPWSHTFTLTHYGEMSLNLGISPFRTLLRI